MLDALGGNHTRTHTHMGMPFKTLALSFSALLTSLSLSLPPSLPLPPSLLSLPLPHSLALLSSLPLSGTLDTDRDVDDPADLGVWWGDSLPSGRTDSSLSDSDSF